MNSYYHPRDHEKKQEPRCHEAYPLPATPVVYTQQNYQSPAPAANGIHTRHDGDPAQGGRGPQNGEGAPYSERDLDVYSVLVAVERGELSVEDAARRLEELDRQAPSESNTELI